MGKKVELFWYQNDDVTMLAKQLLGKILCTEIDGVLTKGIIVETEAYSGNDDMACHANNQKKTKRNEVMFSSGGRAYIYLCYGIHYLTNIVTNKEGNADAVLIRALQPIEGTDNMLKRRNMKKLEKRVSAGPGVLSQAMGISKLQYGALLDGPEIWIEEGQSVDDRDIISSTRIGVEYAGKDALKPWRFYLKENAWVSR